MRFVRSFFFFVLMTLIFSTLPVTAQQPSDSTAVTQPSIAGDENWDDRFGLPFTNALDDVLVYSMLEFQGELYVAGRFQVNQAGYTISTIARWNGRRWTNVGTPLWQNNVPDTYGPSILTMTIYQDQLYVVGKFTLAGGVPAKNIARWDGTTWHAINADTNGQICDLIWFNNELYIVGYFDHIGTTPAKGIARWNGTTWREVAGGLSSSAQVRPEALEVFQQKLYVGGEFEQAGTIATQNLAIWDGSAWSSPGGGAEGVVWDLQTYNNQLYAGGYLFTLDNVPQGVLRWNGSAWTTFTTVLSDSTKMVRTLAVANNELYIGSAQYTNAPFLYRWNGSTLTEVTPRLSTITNGEITAVIAYRGAIHVSGGVGSKTVPYYAQYLMHLEDDQRWHSLGLGIEGIPYYPPSELTYTRNGMTVSGISSFITNSTYNGTATFTGSRWMPEFITDSSVYQIADDGTTTYAILWGVSTPGNVVYQRTTTIWSALLGTFNAAIQQMTAVNGNLYVVGDFTAIDGVPFNHIARWDGSQWQQVGNGFATSSSPSFQDIIVQGSDIYILGWGLRTSPTANYTKILHWDGSQWQDFGITIPINALALDAQGVLYVGGQFSTIAGTPANNIAKYSNGQWSALGSGTNGTVYDLAVDGALLYLGGQFTTVDGVSANNIAQYTNGMWSNLGSGTNSVVISLAVDPQHRLYAVGMFTIAGGKLSSKFAVWHPTSMPNRNPIANNDTTTTTVNLAVTVPVLANDSDPDGDALSIISVSNPTHGTTVISGTTILYTPDIGYVGTDSFIYSISDGRGGMDSATVMILVDGSPRFTLYLPTVVR